MSKDTLGAEEVEAVTQGLSPDLHKGRERYDALMTALNKRYGQNYVYSPSGLDMVESWTGQAVRGLLGRK
ncbi:MAG TPA: hypothetical protein VJJ20_01935 [Candidatus Paceibacterota bacterium]